MSEEPKRIFLGVFESGVTHLVIPAPAIRKAEAVFDAERAKREKLASEAKTRALQQARARGKLKKALMACFGRGRRGR